MKIKNHIIGFFRNLYKIIKLNIYYNYDLRELDIEKELNDLIVNFILLSNEGVYKRFNSYDYYSKSSKIEIVCNSIAKLQAYRDQFPNKRSNILDLINLVVKEFKYLEKPLNKIFEIIEARYLNDKELFFEIRNLIVSEWIERNKYNPDALIHKVKLKDLNYLNYNLEEYQIYLHNCYNFLIRDVKKFINRYPLETLENPNLDLEILLSLRDSIYNDIKLVTPRDHKNNFFQLDKTDFNIFDLIRTEKSEDTLILRGWFKNKPNNCKIDILKYQAYRKNA